MKNIQELTLDELDNVNGGNSKQNNELIKAMLNNKAMSRVVDLTNLVKGGGIAKCLIVKNLLNEIYDIQATLLPGPKFLRFNKNIYHHNGRRISHDDVLNLIKSCHA